MGRGRVGLVWAEAGTWDEGPESTEEPEEVDEAPESFDDMIAAARDGKDDPHQGQPELHHARRAAQRDRRLPLPAAARPVHLAHQGHASATVKVA